MFITKILLKMVLQGLTLGEHFVKITTAKYRNYFLDFIQFLQFLTNVHEKFGLVQ